MNKKIIGIIGGMGSLATVELFRSIVENTPAKKDQDHLNIVINNNPQIPDRNSAILGDGKSPVHDIVNSGKLLIEDNVDFLIMPCNNSHYFYNEIQKELSVPLIDMLEKTCDIIKKMGNDKVGLLSAKGVFYSKIYDRYFKKADIGLMKPSENASNKVFKIIEGVKSNNIKNDFLVTLSEIADEMIESGAQKIVLGCTELSILYKQLERKERFINPIDVLAKEAIELALKRIDSNEKGPESYT